jgi:hypothetical protein
MVRDKGRAFTHFECESGLRKSNPCHLQAGMLKLDQG